MSLAKKNALVTIEDLSEIVSELIAKESGNVLGKNQKSMVISRLKKRLIDLGGMTPGKYFDHLRANLKTETTYLVSILTTHHTFFFREYSHFEFLENNLQQIIKKVKSRGDNKIKIYCAACSRGQEVYSLAMFFSIQLKNYPGIDFEILGSDIDPESVEFAANGVYPFKEVISIPKLYLADHWQRGTGDIAQFAKIKKQIKSKCRFQTVNLLELNKSLKNEKFDIIFCRNVFIYFDNKTIESVCLAFKEFLNPDAYLITGLSESLKMINLNMQTHAPSVYSFSTGSVENRSSSATPFLATKKKIRMLVVDDSAVVVKLLSSMFLKDSDFELAGTAMNGQEAEEFLKHNTVDAMTLDIHMPIMDGVSYLQKNYKDGHPKVVVVSSASRDDARYAQQSIRYGASDFVEKPALDNLKERFEEIKVKIKMSLVSKNIALKIDSEFSQEYAITNVEEKARVALLNYIDFSKLKQFVRELKGEQPPLVIFFQGNKNYLDVLREELENTTSYRCQVYSSEQSLMSNCAYLADFSSDFENIKNKLNNKTTTFSIFGECTPVAADMIKNWKDIHLLIEDTIEQNHILRQFASDIFPWTSFSHVGTEYLCKSAT